MAYIILPSPFGKFKAPTKACLFAWAATKGKIAMEDMLERSSPSNSSRCSMLYSWNVVPKCASNLNFLDSVDCIMGESLTAQCLCICPVVYG